MGSWARRPAPCSLTGLPVLERPHVVGRPGSLAMQCHGRSLLRFRKLCLLNMPLFRQTCARVCQFAFSRSGRSSSLITEQTNMAANRELFSRRRPAASCLCVLRLRPPVKQASGVQVCTLANIHDVDKSAPAPFQKRQTPGISRCGSLAQWRPTVPCLANPAVERLAGP